MKFQKHQKKYAAQSGVALVEFLVGGIAVIGTFIFGVVAISDYGMLRMQAVAGARFAAWQRAAWLPSEIMTTEEKNGVIGATSKTDTELRRDIVRHVLRDRSMSSKSIHSYENSEFNTAEMIVSNKNRVSVRTSKISGKSFTDYKLKISEGLDKAKEQLQLDKAIPNIDKFALWNSPYLRNEVRIEVTVPYNRVKLTGEIVEQVSILTEGWNAGGNLREKTKIKGLVPISAADLSPYKDVRTAGELAAKRINYMYPKFDKDLFQFGFKPGDAKEESPLDRFEQIKDETGKFKPGHFRFYRAFPPPLPPGSLP